MKDRVTIHDVARAAGVSAATVSYVINQREDQSISEKTKQKIWHVINLLNYKPSVFAKNLRAEPHSKLIAVCTGELNPLARAEYLYMLENLTASFPGDYGLLFNTLPCGRLENADAIIAYNVTKETFYEIGNKNFIPLVAVDCLVNDPLFFQITTDYAALKRLADERFNQDYAFVCITPSDENLKSEIKVQFPDVVFVESYDDLCAINSTCVVTLHEIIARFFRSRNVNVFFADNAYLAKCDQTTRCIEQALSHEPFNIHSYKV